METNEPCHIFVTMFFFVHIGLLAPCPAVRANSTFSMLFIYIAVLQIRCWTTMGNEVLAPYQILEFEHKKSQYLCRKLPDSSHLPLTTNIKIQILLATLTTSSISKIFDAGRWQKPLILVSCQDKRYFVGTWNISRHFTPILI